MKIGEIDYNLRTPKRSLFLCKPNKSIIAKINEAYDIQYYTKLGTVNELSFKIPTVIVKDDVPMDNPNIVRIKNRYLFKYVIGSVTEYFLFNETNKNYSDDEYIEYRAYSLGSQLGDKNIREFEMIGNLEQVANGVLDDVYGSLSDVPIKRWSVGYVDSYFTSSDSSYRKYTVSSMSLLEVIYDIATNWDAVIQWDTKNLLISFYKAENVGLNKGFYIRDGKYLESFNLQIDTTSTITRLRAFGSDGLKIVDINETGQEYIQDFSFYMYPFEYDKEQEKVIKSSDYMSDKLCIALMKYNDLVESMKERYSSISETIIALQEILTKEQRVLNSLVEERIRLEDSLDLLLADFQKNKEFWGTNGFNKWGTKEGTPEHLNLVEELRIKREQESTQKTAVQNAELYLQDALNKKQAHLELLSSSKNFSIDEWSELQQFIIEKEYTNDSITDVHDLLAEAKIAFKQNQEPAIKLTVGIIDFLSVVECQNDWNKLSLGDTVKIKYDRLKVNIQAKIIEINYDFENFNITLTIANEKDLQDGSDKLMDLLSKADMTSTVVSMEKDKWNLSKENNGKINDIINNKWNSLKNAVVAGYEQQISISERGIIVKSLEDPNSWLVIQNGFLAITNDSGNSWKHAISKDGIWGEYIFGKVISGVNLNIEDESGVWKTQGSRTTIYNRDGEERMWLGLVSDNARDRFDNLIEQEQECFGLKSWNSATMVEVSDCKGIAISRWKDDEWEKVFWANDTGTLYSRDMVAEQLKIVNNIGDTILDAERNILNIGLFTNIVADGKLTTLEKLQIVKELHSIHADYKAILAHAEKYNLSTRDNVTNIDGAFDKATQTFSTTSSTTNRVNTQPLINAYTALMNYISQYIPIVNKGISAGQTFEVNQNDRLMEETSEITDRGYFVQVFRDYNDESNRLKQSIEDSIYYSGIHMGEYYNNLMMNEFGFVAVRSDGKYRAFLNATNGLALQKWENNHWENKLYASIGSKEYSDGTLIAEELVAKKLRIETKFNEVLLDMDSLNINFSVLESIVVDDVIVSIEKETLKSEWNSIQAQYDELIVELNRYSNEVYSDRDSTYLGLNKAKDQLTTAKNRLISSHLALKNKLDIVFVDMSVNTHLSTELGINRIQFVELFKTLYSSFEYARSSIKNFLEKSSLQLGRNYNNTIIDAVDGVTVYRGDMVNRVQMNATKGFSLSRNDGTYNNPYWTDLFYVGTEGNLYAKDITTHNLKIVNGNLGEKIIFDQDKGITINGNNGEQVTLNANDKIKITVNGTPQFWVGNDGVLYAKKLQIMNRELDQKVLDLLDKDDSYISDLTVTRLRTLDVNDPYNYVHIKKKTLTFMTRYGENDDRAKYEMSFVGEGVNAYPVAIWGTGSGANSNNNKAKQYKTSSGFFTEYVDEQGEKHEINMNTDVNKSIELLSPRTINIAGGQGQIKMNNSLLEIKFGDNSITMTSAGIKINGTRIDLN